MELLEHPRLHNNEHNSIEIHSNPFILGRGLNCDYILTSRAISREHCKFEKYENQWFLRDTSTNGTYVNGELIHDNISQTLKDYDVIQLTADLDSFKFTFRTSSGEDITDEQLCLIADTVLGDIEGSSSNQAVSNAITISDEVSPITTMAPTTYPESQDTSVIPSKRIKLSRRVPPNGVIDLTEDSFSMASTSTNPPTVDLSDSFQIVPSTSSDLKIVIQKIPAPKQINCTLPPTSTEPKEAIETIKEKTTETKENDGDSQVDDELMCAICSEMFVKATTLSCSHTFCKFCIEKWKAKQKICPICRAKITSQVPTLVLDNVIEKVVQNLSKSVQDHRKELLEERKALDEQKNDVRVIADPSSPVMVDSDDEDDDEGSTSTENEDWQDDYISDDWYNQRHPYYGGYGRCYSCQRTGHWANSCPYR